MSTKTNLPILIALLAASAAACSANGEAASQSSEQTVSAEACAAAQAWAEWKGYAVGDVVTFGGAPYACVQSHTSQPGWTPAAVAALWSPVACAGGGTGGGNTGGGNTGGGGSTGGACNASAWVSMASNASACDGHLGESCGWTATNLGQGYHCQATSWGTGCEPGGATCPGGTGGGTGGGTTTPPPAPPAPPPPPAPPGGGTGGTASGFVFGPYKDTSINMNWNTNVISTTVSGAATPMVSDLTASGGKSVTLAFATGECGSENWGGVPGAAMATANAASLSAAGVKYILSTGGAAGSFTCGSDAGMATFLGRWASPGLIGVDFDIEAGQSQAVITSLVQRIKAAHASYPGLRFSLTLATLANNGGGSAAKSMGSGAPSSFNVFGDNTMAAMSSTFGFNGSAATWPSYVTVNLMTMDYGSPGAGVCVVSGGACQMGQSSLQAAYNLHDHFGVPYSAIELTPMIGGNDVAGETFTLGDADTVASFAKAQGLAGVHYWSYDRDIDCPAGSASPTCNSMGGAGAHGFLKRFLANGLK